MSNKDFEIEKICAMCEMSEKIFDQKNVLCHTKGIVSVRGKCRKFKYDALKRVPSKTPKIAPLEYVDIDGENEN